MDWNQIAEKYPINSKVKSLHSYFGIGTELFIVGYSLNRINTNCVVLVSRNPKTTAKIPEDTTAYALDVIEKLPMPDVKNMTKNELIDHIISFTREYEGGCVEGKEKFLRKGGFIS